MRTLTVRPTTPSSLLKPPLPLGKFPAITTKPYDTQGASLLNLEALRSNQLYLVNRHLNTTLALYAMLSELDRQWQWKGQARKQSSIIKEV
jgi:hypothetical protein